MSAARITHEGLESVVELLIRGRNEDDARARAESVESFAAYLEGRRDGADLVLARLHDASDGRYGVPIEGKAVTS